VIKVAVFDWIVYAMIKLMLPMYLPFLFKIHFNILHPCLGLPLF